MDENRRLFVLGGTVVVIALILLGGYLAFRGSPEHTLTVKDGKATLTSPGGIQTSLKLVKAGVYEEETDFDALQLKVVADINDKTLTVSDKYIGCWWTAKWQ